MGNNRIYIGEAAQILNRKVGTIRKWERTKILPKALRPHRDERDWRFFTADQIDKIKQWMIDVDLRPGKGLPTYQDPSPEQIDQHIQNIRVPKTRFKD